MKFLDKLKGFSLGRKKGGGDDDDDDDDVEEEDVEEEGPEEEDEGEGDDGDDDDDDDDDEEGGGKANFLTGILATLRKGGKPRLIIIGGGVAGLVLIIGIALLFSGGDEEESAADKDSAIPVVKLELPPLENDAAAGARGKKGSLNIISSTAKGPSAGIVVPSVTPQAFEQIAAAQTEQPLSQIPDLNLIEQGPSGSLPKVAADGQTSLKAYARPFDPSDNKPHIAIIMTGMGLSGDLTRAVIERLPGAVTLAFDPYAKGLDDWAVFAREKGHETLVALPMESASFPVFDAGPRALQTELSPEENLTRLHYVFSRLSGYVGVISVMGTKFMSLEEPLRPVLQDVQQRGLMFVEAKPTAKSKLRKISDEITLPRAFVDMVLDDVPSKTAITAKLADLEGIVRKKAVAVAITSPYPSSVETIASWAATLEGKNITLVPISAVANRQF
jgi:uncharacterized protein